MAHKSSDGQQSLIISIKLPTPSPTPPIDHHHPHHRLVHQHMTLTIAYPTHKPPLPSLLPPTEGPHPRLPSLQTAFTLASSAHKPPHPCLPRPQTVLILASSAHIPTSPSFLPLTVCPHPHLPALHSTTKDRFRFRDVTVLVPSTAPIPSAAPSAPLPP